MVTVSNDDTVGLKKQRPRAIMPHNYITGAVGFLSGDKLFASEEKIKVPLLYMKSKWQPQPKR